MALFLVTWVGLYFSLCTLSPTHLTPGQKFIREEQNVLAFLGVIVQIRNLCSLGLLALCTIDCFKMALDRSCNIGQAQLLLSLDLAILL